MSSLSRACIEISNSIKGFRLTRSADNAAAKDGGCMNTSTTATSNSPFSTTTNNLKTAASVTSTITRAIKSATNRVRGATSPEQPKNGHGQFAMHAAMKKLTCDNPWEDEKFLAGFFLYFSPCERCVLSQVCKRWKEMLYRSHKYWQGAALLFNCKLWRTDDQGRALFYRTLEERGVNTIIITGATDIDITEFVNNFPNSRQVVQSVGLRFSNVSDRALENMMEKMNGLRKLELTGCNELTESVFWSCLHPRIISLSISDCINVADDSIGAVAHVLPSLVELNLQAYHVTDTSLSFFTDKHNSCLTILRLVSCWEITNQGLLNIIHSLPHISVLSLSGCSKITDEGVELLTGKLQCLTSLDLSWCTRITDAGVEYISELDSLQELCLDRCCHVTDTSMAYLSTMKSLARLYLRWCTDLRDYGLQHLYTMANLEVLSLGGCVMLTATGLTGLVQMKSLQELELSNCPGSNPDVTKFLQDNMPKCIVYE